MRSQEFQYIYNLIHSNNKYQIEGQKWQNYCQYFWHRNALTVPEATLVLKKYVLGVKENRKQIYSKLPHYNDLFQQSVQLIQQKEQKIMLKNSLKVSIKIQEGIDLSDDNKSGKWTQVQNLKYVLFLSKNKVSFQAKLKKRKIRLFQQMAEFIGTRTSIQCRTHHQKYQNKFGTAKSIIDIYKQEIGMDVFKQKMKEHFKPSSTTISDQHIPKAQQQIQYTSIPQKSTNLTNQRGIQTDFPYQWIHYHGINMHHWQTMNFYGYHPEF